MPFSLRSIVLFSASIAASVLRPAEPVVTPGCAFGPPPDDCAVPALLVPGAGGGESFAELRPPLGSLAELFSPPELAGPDGTPLTPEVPAPAEPAFGEPTALLVPPEGPLAAPALPPPPLPPPPLCANEQVGCARIAMAIIDAVRDILVIGQSPFRDSTAARMAGSSPEPFPLLAI